MSPRSSRVGSPRGVRFIVLGLFHLALSSCLVFERVQAESINRTEARGKGPFTRYLKAGPGIERLTGTGFPNPYPEGEDSLTNEGRLLTQHAGFRPTRLPPATVLHSGGAGLSRVALPTKKLTSPLDEGRPLMASSPGEAQALMTSSLEGHPSMMSSLASVRKEAAVGIADDAVRRLATTAAPTLGQVKLALVQRAMAVQRATLFFTLMQQAGFTKVVTDLMTKFPVTLLVPTDGALRLSFAYYARLSKAQKQQLLGYHVLKGYYPLAFLINVKKKTEFATADYDYTVAKKTEKGAPRVGLAPPKVKLPTSYIFRGNVYYNRINVAAHTITALMRPPKFN